MRASSVACFAYRALAASLVATSASCFARLLANSAAPFTLIRDVVTYFDASTNANGSVTVALNLDTGNDSINVITNYIIYSRN